VIKGKAWGKAKPMTNRTVLKWTGIVTVLLLFSRITGFLREIAIASRFGATAEVDAYLIAALLPMVLFIAVNDAVKSTFIPVYREYHHNEEGNAFALTVFVILGAILFVVSAALVAGAPVVVRLLAPRYIGNQFENTVAMARILLPGLFFMGMAGLASGVLYTKKNFIIPAIPAYPSNIIIILTAVIFGGRYGIMSLAWGTIVGFSTQFLIQIPAVAKHGVFKRDKLLWGHPGLRKIAVLLPPVLLSGAAVEIKGVIDRSFATLLPEGSVAWLNYANRIYLLPNGILIIALLSVLYPTLVELNVEGKAAEFKQMLRQGLGLVIMAVMPMMVGLFVLSEPAVRLMFERQAFTPEDTRQTAYALAFYSLGMVALGAQQLMYRSFYALKDTVTPMVVTIVIVSLNILFNCLLIGPLAHGGIALGTALAMNVGVIFIGILLYRKIGMFGGRQLVDTFIKSAVAAILMGVLLYLGKGFLGAEGFTRQALELGLLMGSGATVYFLLAYLLRVNELNVALQMIRSRMAR
jgi:putative peptidoglycan lipid II flippase